MRGGNRIRAIYQAVSTLVVLCTWLRSYELWSTRVGCAMKGKRYCAIAHFQLSLAGEKLAWHCALREAARPA